MQFKREPLTDYEVNNLISSCQTPQEKLVIFTLLDTGLRISEFCKITKENLDWSRHELIVFGKNPKDKNKPKRRVVPLSPRLHDILENFIAAHGKIPFGIQTAQNIVNKVGNRAAIRKQCCPHVLRHTFAVGQVRKGVSLPTLMKLLGHSNLQTTAIYLNISPEDAIREYREKNR